MGIFNIDLEHEFNVGDCVMYRTDPTHRKMEVKSMTFSVSGLHSGKLSGGRVSVRYKTVLYEGTIPVTTDISEKDLIRYKAKK